MPIHTADTQDVQYITLSHLLSKSKTCQGVPLVHLKNLAISFYPKAIQKNNLEGARIHGENAIRQKNQVS